jgi:hypothetical protein
VNINGISIRIQLVLNIKKIKIISSGWMVGGGGKPGVILRA